ncbi:hypothetical protein MtrunA17_Chr6g0488571 [Medicago truncatula]|uniref:Uncharacterized protein n=1 Tax=Medicago truncatula TaxID=3880 RepID=A0A396HKR7_MEDTR|nr:hypothetical protein MtrunA17_Chr6g0488571 [Medicago truncatula]
MDLGIESSSLHHPMQSYPYACSHEAVLTCPSRQLDSLGRLSVHPSKKPLQFHPSWAPYLRQLILEKRSPLQTLLLCKRKMIAG